MEYLVAWLALGALVYLGWLTTRRRPGRDLTAPTRSGASPRGAGLKWSGAADHPLPIKQLTRQQSDCLDDLVDGAKLTARNGGGFDVRGKEVWTYNARTVSSLVKHGMLRHDPDGIAITDLGLRAQETLPTRY